MKNTDTTQLKDYTTYCKDFSIAELEGLKDNNKKVYMCDLAHELTQTPNIDGTATYSTYEAKEYIKAWWDEAAEVYEYQKMNYGECLQNPFESPEAFHVCMIIEGVSSILSQCEIIEENWNEKITLTDKIIGILIEQIKLVDEICF